MTNKSNTYFSQVAEQWDQLRQGYFPESLRSLAIQKAYLRPEMSVADIGGGTGFLSAGLLPLVKEVHLVDASPEMLIQAQKNLNQWENLHTHQADGLSIPLEDESLDAVFANMYLHHCPDPAGAIREMARLLKTNGRLVLTDLDSHPYEWLKEEMADEWLGFDRDQIRSWFREAGLVNIFADCTEENCCASSQNETGKSDAKISTFIAVGSKPGNHKESVQTSYRLIALGDCSCSAETNSQTSDCCPPANQNRLYSPEQLSDIPTEAGQLSLGCGNPTAIANLKPGETVVDIGSGAGLDCFLAAKKVGPTGKVIGVDMTDAMLERAAQSTKKHGITNVEFRRGEAHALPVEDASADVILSNCVINLTDDKGLVFKEARRILKSGGRLEISDTVITNTLPTDVVNEPKQWSACVSGSLPVDEYLDLIREAGFIIVKKRTTTPMPVDEYLDLIREAGFIIVKKRTTTPMPVDEHSAIFSITISAEKP